MGLSRPFPRDAGSGPRDACRVMLHKALVGKEEGEFARVQNTPFASYLRDGYQIKKLHDSSVEKLVIMM